MPADKLSSYSRVGKFIGVIPMAVSKNSDRVLRVAIIGAGIRGIVSAAYFKQKGYDITVFEKRATVGGIWRQVYPTSVINTPGHGYTFHYTNRWTHRHPCRQEVLDNLQRVIDVEELRDNIRTGVDITGVTRTSDDRWRLNDIPDSYDGVLVCSGHLGQHKKPEPETFRHYLGSVVFPYRFDPDSIRDKKVVVIGSGNTALEMLSLSLTRSCAQATLVIRPGTSIIERGWRQDLNFWIASSPFLYKLTKRGSHSQAAAVSQGIMKTLARENCRVMESDSVQGGGNKITLDNGVAVEADTVIWCTGWHSPTSDWVHRYIDYASFVPAMCPFCRDTKGFGLGSSTIYAKMLEYILRYELTEPFRTPGQNDSCESQSYQDGAHIIGVASRYLLQQKGGNRMFLSLLLSGFSRNARRLFRTKEPVWISLLSFVHAPFGL